jgi:hypothetical protein
VARQGAFNPGGKYLLLNIRPNAVSPCQSHVYAVPEAKSAAKVIHTLAAEHRRFLRSFNWASGDESQGRKTRKSVDAGMLGEWTAEEAQDSARVFAPVTFRVVFLGVIPTIFPTNPGAQRKACVPKKRKK